MPVASDPEFDYALEKMRECLRDLKTVVDNNSALVVRERCKDRLTAAARKITNVREDYADIGTRLTKAEKLVETRDAQLTKLDTLVEMVLDVDRGVRTVDELTHYVKLVYTPLDDGDDDE
jgi:hypothetical protein